MRSLKNLLEDTVERYEYDFCHPDVVAVSQRLDQLIVRILINHTNPES